MKEWVESAAIQPSTRRYNARSELKLTQDDVRLYELCMAASWYISMETSEPGSGEAMNRKVFFAGLLRRCVG